MFGTLEAFRTRPIPDLSAERDARKGSRQHPIDTTDARYAESLVDLRTLSITGSNHYYREDNPPYWERIPGSIPELYVRTSLAEKLARINQTLAPHFEVFVHDAWRPQKIQTYFHETWFPAYLRNLHPEWSEEQVQEETGNYWAKGVAREDLIDLASPSPHSTGGVVDLTLRVKGGDLLWMGMQFDDCGPWAHADYLEHHSDGSLSAEEAKKNRRLLYWLMTEEGFMVNPNEIWHASLGDQMWAKIGSCRDGTTKPAYFSAAKPVTYTE